MESKCANFNENDEICCDCAAGDVEIRQACYTCFKNENEKKSTYRREPLNVVNGDDINNDGDKVNPNHYKMDDGRQVIDVIRLMLTEDEVRGFCKGNYLKYMLRAGKKVGELAETDRKKAAWYLDYLEKLDKVEFLPAGISELNFKYLDSAELIDKFEKR